MGLVGLVGRVGKNLSAVARAVSRDRRWIGLITVALTATACTRDAVEVSLNMSAPPDAQHRGITTPHGDHAPHHGGLVLMNGELHYEVVFDREGRHRIWFSDAVRQDLPASVARDVVMTVTRPNDAPERLTMTIDDAGESWVASGRPVAGEHVMTKITYVVQGAPYEVEIPFVRQP